jgi:methionyl aminopeptidase
VENVQQIEIDAYVKAGEIAKEVKSFARGLIKPGVKLIDVAEGVDAKIVELGGEAAFPVNLSLNEVAAHYTPEPGDEKVAEGILKVDIGVAVDGYIADTAFSVDLSEDGEFGDMMALNEKILAEIGGKVRVGMEIREVGDVAQDVLEGWNKENGTQFAIIKGLSGHVLGRNKIHAGLTISNYRNDNRTVLGDVAFAIEPFVTTGVGDIYEGPVGGIYVLQDDKPVRDRNAREVLKFIKEKYKTRPFCLRFLVKEFDLSVAKLKFILKGMVKVGVLHEYPMLIEKSRKPVSQAEDTFVVGGGVVCTTGNGE